MATPLAFPTRVSSDASQTTTPIGFNDDPIGLRWTADQYHILGYAAAWKGSLGSGSSKTSVTIADADYWVFNNALVFANGPVAAPTLRLAFVGDRIGVNTASPTADLHVAGTFRAVDTVTETLVVEELTPAQDASENHALVLVNRRTGRLHYYDPDSDNTRFGAKTEFAARGQTGAGTSGGTAEASGSGLGGAKLTETELKIAEGVVNPSLLNLLKDDADQGDASPGKILDSSGEPFDPSRLEEGEGGR